MEKLLLVDLDDNPVGSINRGSEKFIGDKLAIRAVVVAIFNKSNEVLLSKASSSKEERAGKWLMSVNGHVDDRDVPIIETARKETIEELGFNPDNLYFVHKFLFNYHGLNVFVNVFKCTIDENTELVLDPNEIEKSEFVKLDFELLEKEYNITKYSYMLKVLQLFT
jgi:isopentenyldiphosphate isomerase